MLVIIKAYRKRTTDVRCRVILPFVWRLEAVRDLLTVLQMLASVKEE